ncbi:hypothetical protein EPO56_00235 [Patescibacteria group bacterium]|nr:MAG: hypothetical protein EPO56_00235 [Patescibacteria group bacterium]
MSNEGSFQLVADGEMVLNEADHRDIGNAILRCIEAATTIFGRSYSELSEEERNIVTASLRDGNQNLN